MVQMGFGRNRHRRHARRARGSGAGRRSIDRRPDDREPDGPVGDLGFPGSHGFPAGLWRALERHPPPGVQRLGRWRSPLRGPWLTSVFGLVLLVTLPIITITGLLSYMAYAPQ